MCGKFAFLSLSRERRKICGWYMDWVPNQSLHILLFFSDQLFLLYWCVSYKTFFFTNLNSNPACRFCHPQNLCRRGKEQWFSLNCSGPHYWDDVDNDGRRASLDAGTFWCQWTKWRRRPELKVGSLSLASSVRVRGFSVNYQNNLLKGALQWVSLTWTPRLSFPE